MLKQLGYKIILLLLSVNLLSNIVAASEAEQPQITFSKINDNFWVLHGGNGLGANAGLSIGDDGLVLIDAMNINTGQKLIEAIRTISDKPIKYVINTHQHRDHRGGNEELVELGATVIYPDFLKYLTDASTTYQGAARELQFSDKLSLKLNNEIFDLYHVKSHTWNDVIVHLRNNNLLFTGDNHATSWGPNIGVQGLKSHQDVFELLFSLADDKTLVVPGHKALADLKHLIEYDKKTKDWFNLILNSNKQGLSAEEIVKESKIGELLAWFHGGQLPAWLTKDKQIYRISRSLFSIESLNIQLSDKQKEQYLGLYQLEDGTKLEIFKHKGELIAYKENTLTAHLIPLSNSHFAFNVWNEKEHFKFELDKSGYPLSLTFMVNDKTEFSANKL